MHPDIGVWQFAESLLHSLDGLRLIFLNCEHARAAAQHALHNGSAHDDFLGALKHNAVVAGKIRLALRSVDNQALGLASRSRVELDVGREGRSSESHNSVLLDLFENLRPVGRDFGYEGIAEIYPFGPLVSLNGNLDMGNHLACNVGARGDGLDGTGSRRMHEGGNEARRLGKHLAYLDLVPYCYHRGRRSSKMLGHRHIDSLRKRQSLNRAVARQLGVVRMDSSYSESNVFHC